MAATIPLTEAGALFANMRKYYLFPEATRIDALDVYCSGCRLTMDAAGEDTCAAKGDNRHLIGGDQAHRKKRKVTVPPQGAVVEPGPAINRRGLEFYSAPHRPNI